MEEQEEQAEVLVVLSSHQWEMVVKNDARGDLLEEARSGDTERVLEFLDALGAG